jgi:ABC-type glycerol-3-phosphate transport system substrate-binding protein
VLWSDHAEAAPIVELFNASQDRYVVELVYHSDVNRQLRLDPEPADVVIARSIEDSATARLFRSLEPLLRNGVDPSRFYAQLLATTERSGRHQLLPVSFNLPLVYFTDAALPPGITVTPEAMREASAEFAVLAEGRAEYLGFSPLWDSRFLYELVRISGLDVRESSDGTPEWSFEGLLAGISFSREWVEEANGGIEADSAFREKYLYEPQAMLVRSGRVLFGYDTSDGYFERSDLAREDLDFRWLGSEGSVPVLETITYAGIPERAENRAGAEAFLTWFLDPEVQTEILATNQRKRIDRFGLLGGFSSLWEISERAIPQYHPELESRVPPAAWLEFPDPHPRHWESVTREIVEPWLAREVGGQPQARDLEASVRAWLLQQEE